ncbi:MAG: hypothetical protein ACO2OO_01030 [Candidatus Aenigmatarchaeota archaeon]
MKLFKIIFTIIIKREFGRETIALYDPEFLPSTKEEDESAKI